jgi:predicted RNA-binding protein associated with RNAse of E/G family
MQGQPILETKETLDGHTQTFACTAVFLTPRLAVVRFEHGSTRQAGGFIVPAAGYTLGFFWKYRPYNCYRFTGPDDAVIAYRFDVVDRVRIDAGHVSYRDLLLDVWRSPRGVLTIEDEDEVDQARAAGLLSPASLARINRTRSLLIRRHDRIVAECESIIAGI